MKQLVAIAMGFFSGFLIYMAAALLFFGPDGGEPSPGFVAVMFFGGWVLSTWLLLRGARTTAKVASRGFLLGAAEWFVMILAGLVFGARAATSVGTADEAEQAGAAIGGGLVAMLTGGFSFVMALICLAGFAIAYFMGKEMQPEVSGDTRKCPDCAELVKAEARKCRHCGASLVQEPGFA